MRGHALTYAMSNDLTRLTHPASTIVVQSTKTSPSANAKRMTGRMGSCPIAWCKSGGVIALCGRVGRFDQAATAGSLTMGSSLNGAMVSSVM